MKRWLKNPRPSEGEEDSNAEDEEVAEKPKTIKEGEEDSNGKKKQKQLGYTGGKKRNAPVPCALLSERISSSTFSPNILRTACPQLTSAGWWPYPMTS